jgi:xylulokinase
MGIYLGVDIGTFESKGVLVNEAGEILAQASKRHEMLVPQPGWAEHRADEDWWGDFVAITRTLLADSGIDPKAIRAIGTSGIGPCLLPIDVDGKPLMNAILYGVDGRAEREIADMTQAIGTERLYEFCGNGLSAQSVGPKILWMKRNRPDLFEKTHAILNSTSYLVYKLTESLTLDHYSASSYTPLYDVAAKAWSNKLVPDLIDIGLMPKLLWSTEIAGEVTSAAAQETGLAIGTPVITGTIDAAAEAISVGAMAPGDLMVMYGSSIFAILVTSSRHRDPRIWYAPWLFRGEHAAMAGHPTAGTLTHWFRQEFARDLDPATAVVELAEEAATSPPGASGLLFLPYLSGAVTPLYNPRAKGAWFGLDLTHKRADLLRALFEGIGFAAHAILEAYRDAGLSLDTVYAVGGGTKNKIWSQATSDISGFSQVIRKYSFGAAYGDAYLAGRAIGDLAPNVIELWNPVYRKINPNAALASLYRDAYQRFRMFYDATASLL